MVSLCQDKRVINLVHQNILVLRSSLDHLITVLRIYLRGSIETLNQRIKRHVELYVLPRKGSSTKPIPSWTLVIILMRRLIKLMPRHRLKGHKQKR